MTTTVVTNPKTFTISDPNAVAQGVTGFTIEYGTTEGGPYPNVFQVPAAEVSADEASGTITGPIPTGLAPGTYYAVAYATNATGKGPVSNEVGFSVPLALPGAPTLSVA
jgi:hypothetical protein